MWTKIFHKQSIDIKVISLLLTCFCINLPINVNANIEPGKEFTIYDEMRFENKPDLKYLGIDDVRVVYASEMWPRGQFSDEINEEFMSNFFSRSIFKDAPFVCIDIEHWPLDIRIASEAEVNLSISRYIRVIEIFKKHNPNVPVGFYGMIPIRDYFAPVRNRNKQAWHDANKKIAPIADKVDIIFPSLYTFYQKEDEWDVYATANINEAKKYGKKVMPFIWPQYHGSNKTLGGQYIDGKYWQRQLETIYKNAESLIIWTPSSNAPNWDIQAEWWNATRNFMDTIKPQNNYAHKSCPKLLNQ